MKHGSSGKRSRGRSGSNRGNANRRGAGKQGRSRVYDSNGPDVRIRGTAHQVFEKYATLAKDASGVGDHVLAESYLQHAEHYQRIISSWNEEAPSQQQNKTETPVEKTSGTDQKDDLGLPESIVGKKVPASSKKKESSTVKKAEAGKELADA